MIKIGESGRIYHFSNGIQQKDLELIKKYKVPCVYLLHAEKAGSMAAPSDCEYSGYLIGKLFGKYKEYKSFYINVKTSAESKTRLADLDAV